MEFHAAFMIKSLFGNVYATAYTLTCLRVLS
jgi:hypothetical protein